LLESVELDIFPNERILQSNLAAIPRAKRTLSPDEVVTVIKEPSQSSTSLHEVLVRGLVELSKVKPVGNDAVQWLGEWLLVNNPNQPKILKD
jgi:Dpy-30 motif